jgi:hypothetical protein
MAKADAGAAPEVGQPCRIAIDPRRLHWFHPESGERL